MTFLFCRACISLTQIPRLFIHAATISLGSQRPQQTLLLLRCRSLPPGTRRWGARDLNIVFEAAEVPAAPPRAHARRCLCRDPPQGQLVCITGSQRLREEREADCPVGWGVEGNRQVVVDAVVDQRLRGDAEEGAKLTATIRRAARGGNANAQLVFQVSGSARSSLGLMHEDDLQA